MSGDASRVGHAIPTMAPDKPPPTRCPMCGATAGYCGTGCSAGRPRIAHVHSVIGDCDNCGHSVIYHLPLAGCMKCSCDEFSCRPSTSLNGGDRG